MYTEVQAVIVLFISMQMDGISAHQHNQEVLGQQNSPGRSHTPAHLFTFPSTTYRVPIESVDALSYKLV